MIFSSDGALKLSVGALFRRKNGWGMLVVRDGTARLQAVEVPRRSTSQALIEKGLEAGTGA